MTEPGAYSRVPVWAGRQEWLAEVEARGATAGALDVARVLAEAADGRTGRGVALSVETAAERAGVTDRTVRRARAWLAAEGLAVEVLRGRHLTRAEREARRAVGARGIRTASVWALTGGVVSAHPSGFSREGSSGSHYSPKARRAGTRRKPSTTETPKSLRLQRLTAEVVRRVPGLDDGGHLGGLAGVIGRALGQAVREATAADVLAIAEAGGRGRVWSLEGVRDVRAWLGARLRSGRASGFLTVYERASRDAEARAQRDARRRADREADEARVAASRPEVVQGAKASIRAAIVAARRTHVYGTHQTVIVRA